MRTFALANWMRKSSTDSSTTSNWRADGLLNGIIALVWMAFASPFNCDNSDQHMSDDTTSGDATTTAVRNDAMVEDVAEQPIVRVPNRAARRAAAREATATAARNDAIVEDVTQYPIMREPNSAARRAARRAAAREATAARNDAIATIGVLRESLVQAKEWVSITRKYEQDTYDFLQHAYSRVRAEGKRSQFSQQYDQMLKFGAQADSSHYVAKLSNWRACDDHNDIVCEIYRLARIIRT